MNKEQYKYKLFGRSKGRKKNTKSFFDFLNNFDIDIKKNVNREKYIILDIGSGSGENAIHLSKLYPNAQIIACDLFRDGNINLYNQIIIYKIKNIFIYQGNVLEFLDTLDQSFLFNQIWILFPDPWPKTRHHKRRLINHSFLQYLHSFFKNSGNLFLASDSQSYNYSIIKLIYETKNLYFWENQSVENWDYSMLNLPKTKFYKKALKSNRNSMFFKLYKI